MDTTHCELAGMYSILRVIECIITYYQVDEPHVELGCDCEGGLARTLLNSNPTPLRYVHVSYLDLINPINEIKRLKVLNATGRHIRGHQDDYCIYENLDWLGQCNVDMDALVK